MCQTIFYVKIEILLRISEGFLAASKLFEGSHAFVPTLVGFLANATACLYILFTGGHAWQAPQLSVPTENVLYPIPFFVASAPSKPPHSWIRSSH